MSEVHILQLCFYSNVCTVELLNADTFGPYSGVLIIKYPFFKGLNFPKYVVWDLFLFIEVSLFQGVTFWGRTVVPLSGNQVYSCVLRPCLWGVSRPCLWGVSRPCYGVCPETMFMGCVLSPCLWGVSETMFMGYCCVQSCYDIII